MADAKPCDQRPDEAAGASCSQSGELELLREETKRLRRLVVELSKVAIRNAINQK